jgi:hypothetical protein
MLKQILSWLPLVLGLGLVVYVVVTVKGKPVHWGKPIAIVWGMGLLICILAAWRDGYGFSDTSVIAFTGLPATLFSLLGMSVMVISLTSLFIRNQVFRQKAFIIIAVIFMIKWIAMEAIRILA